MGLASIRALHWTAEGELSPSDRLDLLRSLVVHCSVPEVQYELVRTVELLSVTQLDVSRQVTLS
ncbi:hypothetical protein SynRS9909_01001 [Synechococcus sp. RS9909]|uniref:hypothetical protein n=1 Tax=unclassified Synechococcus TaxID=2626047 RepID=UPI0000690E55|nr:MULTISPECIES: hypothetical protein [unclassified Synechococcus]EAQ68866.1 hypothetical protein RS9917_00862 [Synechococcus sp. RS9917]QNI78993.1 hypothetical protein SynRS9909_01001 [Synechococcus sp. RS9909]